MNVADYVGSYEEAGEVSYTELQKGQDLKTVSQCCAYNRLWVVAPSMWTDRRRQPMRSSESGVPHDLTHP